MKVILQKIKILSIFVITLFLYGEIQSQSISNIIIDETFEDFNVSDWQEGNNYGYWYDNFNGYGTVGIFVDSVRAIESRKVLFQKPKASSSIGETHSCLVTSIMEVNNFDMSILIKTVRQLRTPSPNAWETAWVLWHYTDNTHFYYFTLKTNGWELGKEDPAYPGAQRFLLTGSNPKVTLGQYQLVEIKQKDSTITISVDGQQVAVFMDEETPYLKGKLGLYNEDAFVTFDDITVLTDSTTTMVEHEKIIPQDFELTAYPNPFNSQLTIEFNRVINVPANITIYDISGSIINHYQIYKANRFQWNGKNLYGNYTNSGIYIIQVQQDNKYDVIKVLQIK